MGKATPKQINWLKKIGIPNADNYEFEDAKKTLGAYFNLDSDGKATFLENLKKENPVYDDMPNPVKVGKPKTDTSSYYVAYAKDIVVAMINAGKDRQILELMEEAVEAIKIAKDKL